MSATRRERITIGNREAAVSGQGKPFYASRGSGQHRSVLARLAKLSGMLLFAGIMSGGDVNMGFLRAKEVRAEQRRTEVDVGRVLQLHTAVVRTAGEVQSHFDGMRGALEDPESHELPAGVTIQMGYAEARVQALITAVDNFFQALGQPITVGGQRIPAHRAGAGGNSQARFEMFTRWVTNGREALQAITPELLVGVLDRCSASVPRPTIAEAGADAVMDVVDARIAARTAGDEEEEETGGTALAATPTLTGTGGPGAVETAGVTVTPPDEEEEGLDFVIEITPERAILSSVAGEQERMQAMTTTAVQIVNDIMGAIPADFPNRESLRRVLASSRDNLQAYVRENTGNLSWDAISSKYLDLTRDVNTASLLIHMWNSVGAAGRTDEVRELFSGSVRMIMDFTYNPVESLTDEELSALGRQYLNAGIGHLAIDTLRPVLQELAQDLEASPRELTVPASLRTRIQETLTAIEGELARRGGPRAEQMRRLSDTGNRLIMEADLCRSYLYRYDGAIYNAYDALIPRQFTETRLDDAAAEAAVGNIALVTAARSRIRYAHVLMGSELGGSPLFSSGDYALRGGAVRTAEGAELYTAHGALEYLQEAISVAGASGMAADDPVLVAARGMHTHYNGQADLEGQALYDAVQRVYHSAVGLLAIREAQLWIANREGLTTADAAAGRRAQAALASARTWYANAFGNPAVTIEYQAEAEIRAYTALEAILPRSAMLLGHVGQTRGREYIADRIAFAFDLRTLTEEIADINEDEEMGAAERRELAAPIQEEITELREDLADFDYSTGVTGQLAFEREHIRLMVRLGREEGFGITPTYTREAATGFALADGVLDIRHGRLPSIPEEERRSRPTEDLLDTNLDHDGLTHIMPAVPISDSGFLLYEFRRQRSIAADTTAPAVLRQPVQAFIPGFGDLDADLRRELGEFSQLDLPSIEAAITAVARAYGTEDYRDVALAANRVLIRMLDGRIDQLTLLLRHTERPSEAGEAQIYYDIASNALDEAVALRSSLHGGLGRNMFDESFSSGNPLEAITIAENGLVSLSNVPGFGTHMPTHSLFFVQLRASPRRAGDTVSIVVEHTLIRTEDHPDGVDIADFQRAGGDVGRLWYGYLIAELVPGVGYLIRNPRYNPERTDADQPRFLGWMDMRHNVVRPLRPLPTGTGTPGTDITVNIRDYIIFDEIMFRLDPNRPEPEQPIPDLSDEATMTLLMDRAHTPSIEEPGSRHREGADAGDVMTEQTFPVRRYGAETRAGVYVRRIFRRRAPPAAEEAEVEEETE